MIPTFGEFIAFRRAARKETCLSFGWPVGPFIFQHRERLARPYSRTGGPCEALENALEQIRAVTFEPKQTLPAVKRRIAKILIAVRD